MQKAIVLEAFRGGGLADLNKELRDNWKVINVSRLTDSANLIILEKDEKTSNKISIIPDN